MLARRDPRVSSPCLTLSPGDRTRAAGEAIKRRNSGSAAGLTGAPGPRLHIIRKVGDLDSSTTGGGIVVTTSLPMFTGSVLRDNNPGNTDHVKPVALSAGAEPTISVLTAGPALQGLGKDEKIMQPPEEHPDATAPLCCA